MNQLLLDFAAQSGHYLVKSPLNYVGGKFKLLSQIRPLMPAGVRTFVDVFCGGFNVGANASADRILGVDLDKDVIALLSWMRDTPTHEAVLTIEQIVRRYGLGPGRNGVTEMLSFAPDVEAPAVPDEGEEPSERRHPEEIAYYDLRARYNAARLEGASTLDGFDMRAVLYALICHAFSNYIRFSPKGFNLPFGKRTLNDALARNFTDFSARLHAIKPEFLLAPFSAVPEQDLDERDYVYADPPYLITTAPYNEMTGWSESDDAALYAMLDGLAARGVRFGLSNVIEHKGRTNEILKAWASNYHLHDLDFDYDTASYNLKDREGRTREVFVTNYTP